MSEVYLSRLIKLEKISRSIDFIFRKTGMPVAIVDLEGQVLYSNISQILSHKFHNSALKSDPALTEIYEKMIEGLHHKEECTLKCSSGLYSIGLPIRINGVLKALMLLCHFKFDFDLPVETELAKHSSALGIDGNELNELMDKLPTFNRQETDEIKEYYSSFIKLVEVTGEKNLELEQKIELQRKIENKLRESNRKYKLLADNASDVIWTCDLSFNFDYISPSIERILGYTSEEALSKPLEEMLTPDTFQKVQEALADFLKKEEKGEKHKVVRLEPLEIVRKDGTTVFTEVLATPLWDQVGKATGILGVTRDISDRMQANRQLEESRERYRALAETTFEGIVITRDGVILEANKRLSEIIGHDLEEMKGRPAKEFLHSEDAEMALWHAGNNMETPYECRLVHKYGHTIYTQVKGGQIDYRGEKARVASITDISNRKQLQDELERFFSLSPEVITILDKDLNFQRVSPSIEKVLGRNPEEMLGKSIVEYVHPDDQERMLEALRDRLIENKAIKIKSRYICKDGKTRWISWNAVRTLDGLTYALGRDISVRVITERALAESEEKFRSMVESAAVGISRLDMQGRLLSANPSFLKMFGYGAEELGSLNWQQFVAPESREEIDKLATGLLEGKDNHFTMESRLVKKDGSKLWARFTVSRVFSNMGEPRFFIAMIEDISNEKEIEIKLRENEKRFRRAVETMPFPVLIADEKNNIKYINPAFENLIGYSLDEMPDMKTGGKLWFPDEKEREASMKLWEQRRNKKGGAPVYLSPTSRDGRRLSVISRVITMDDGTIYAVSEDITEKVRLEKERRNIEAQLRRQQRLESMGTLSSGVAHEINNPIQIIMNLADLISEETNNIGEIHSYSRDIIRESERIAVIVRNLLIFSQSDKSGMRYSDISEVISTTLSLMNTVIKKDQIRIVTELSSDLPRVHCQPRHIMQVLMSLFSNAREALNRRYPNYHPEKKVIIKTSTFENDGQDYLRISVEDTGVGIKADIMDRIFDPFFTTNTRDKSAGLGLSISHGIISDHNGKLTAESQVNEFTRFNIDLPI